MNEFELIKKYFRPLANNSAALALLDDAAIINISDKKDLILAKDAIVEGVHFPDGETPENIASKLFRVNLSDMAAMGAKPKHYLLATMFNDTVGEKWIKSFSAALKKEQKKFGIELIGGDTTKHKGKLAFSLTMIGEVPRGKALLRSGAKEGDLIFVSGTIGDSALGLMAIQNKLPRISKKAKSFLIDRYRKPEPRVTLGQALIGIANAAMDISDGLIQDVSHICAASKLGAVIEADKIPLSDSAVEVLSKNKKLRESIFTGGDDYELVFTISPKKLKHISTIGKKLGLKLTNIGEIRKKSGLDVLDSKGQKIILSKAGYSHF